MKDNFTIYKYRDWLKPEHKKVILNNELFFASPSDMNDPFDFQITPDLDLLDTHEKRTIFISALVDDYKTQYEQQGIDIEKIKLNLSNEIENSIEKIQNEYDEVNRRYTNNRFGVISFSKRWDSVLMWSHYSNNHKGFCVGFDKNKIINSGFVGSAGSVIYKDDYPTVDPISPNLVNELFSKSHIKAKEWHYEEEFRVTNLWDVTPSEADRVLKFHDDSITEIILGLNIDKTSEADIMKHASLKSIPVFQIVRKSKSFRLDKVRVM